MDKELISKIVGSIYTSQKVNDYRLRYIQLLLDNQTESEREVWSKLFTASN